MAGVSAATVSMALADSPRVAERTRLAVRHAADQLDYVPNSMGRGLRAQRLDAIALVIPLQSEEVFSHPYFMEILQGISEIADDADFTLVLSTSRGSEDDSAYRKLLRSRRADGVIVASAAAADRNLDRLVASGYPVVYLGRYPHDSSVCTVGIDDHGGAAAATSHLLETHGRRRVAHLAGPLDHLAFHDRFEGYRAALGRAGLPHDERLVISTGDDASESAGEAACDQLLRAGVDFDAIFGGDDEIAIGAMRALRKVGRRVPEDVSVASFDDIRVASVHRPALTTIRQPMRETGRLAARRLLGLLSGATPEPAQIVLPTELVIRTSCGCAEVIAA
ncbi:MAG: LacI family transcriptional regulator [Chloroflexota bacterium]|nr:LacI family transcriptional regulator [Chloroflexota bacterium]